jgi:hypothetical protein
MTLAEAPCNFCKALVDRSINQHQGGVMKVLIDLFTWGMIAYGLYGLITTMWSIISKKRRENSL